MIRKYLHIKRTIFAFSAVSFLFGVFLIYLSYLVEDIVSIGNLSKYLHDIGMILGPIGLFSLVFQFLSKDYDEYLNQRRSLSTNGQFLISINYEERFGVLKNMLMSAKFEIIIVGVAPLDEFRIKYTDKLAKKFSKIKNVDIFILSPTSSHVEHRADQLYGYSHKQFKNDIIRSKESYFEIIEKMRGDTKHVSLYEYDIFPSDYFCLVDRRLLLASGRSIGFFTENFYSVYVFDINNDLVSSKIIQLYSKIYEFICDHNKTVKIPNDFYR